MARFENIPESVLNEEVKILQDVEPIKEDFTELEQILDEEIKVALNEDMNDLSRKGDYNHMMNLHYELMGQNIELLKANKDVLAEDSKHSHNYTKAMQSNINIQLKQHEIEKKVESDNLKFKALYITLGGIIVYVFPEVLPYLEKFINFVKG